MRNTRFLIVLLAVALLTALASACAGFQTQHQKIGAACETAASALDALTAAKVAGKIDAAKLNEAIAVYKPTKAFCEPVATKLSDVDYQVLIDAAADLTTKKAEVQ